MDWLIEDWLPIGHRAEDTAPEGSFKTIWGCYCAVCIASGCPILGHKVQQGPVLIIDEETPEASLQSHLSRFAQGLNYKSWDVLPITPLSMTGFRFGRKTELNRLITIIELIQPVFIRLDSLIAMLPGGRQAVSENDCHLGETIRDDLNKMLQASLHCTTLLAVHTKKFVSELGLEELMKDMQTLVRGHGSIVGEGCDTGYVLKKISEYPERTRFAILTKARRQAIPMVAKIVYVEMEEESYGEGWVRFKEIPASVLPPCEYARALFPLFLDKDYHKSSEIVKSYAFFSRKESWTGIKELIAHRVILEGSKPQTYVLNPNLNVECDQAYLSLLKK